MIVKKTDSVPQRVRGKFDYSMTDSWDGFKQLNPELAKKLGRTKYNKILFHSNQLIADTIINSNSGIRLPERGGWLYIMKYLPKNRRANEQLSKEYDKKVVYINAHTAGFSYKFYWAKRIKGVRNIDAYTFRACRKIKRRLAKILLNGERDYLEKVNV